MRSCITQFVSKRELAPCLPPVDLAAVPDPNDRHDQLGVHDLVQDAIVALANPVLLIPAKLIDADRSWVVSEASVVARRHFTFSIQGTQ